MNILLFAIGAINVVFGFTNTSWRRINLFVGLVDIALGLYFISKGI